MKKAEEYYNEFISKLPRSQEFRKFVYSLDKNELINIIKQIQSKTIEETCRVCAKNAIANISFIGWLSENLEYYNIQEDQDYELSIDKQSILNCAELLKKEIE